MEENTNKGDSLDQTNDSKKSKTTEIASAISEKIENFRMFINLIGLILRKKS